MQKILNNNPCLPSLRDKILEVKRDSRYQELPEEDLKGRVPIFIKHYANQRFEDKINYEILLRDHSDILEETECTIGGYNQYVEIYLVIKSTATDEDYDKMEEICASMEEYFTLDEEYYCAKEHEFLQESVESWLEHNVSDEMRPYVSEKVFSDWFRVGNYSEDTVCIDNTFDGFYASIDEDKLGIFCHEIMKKFATEYMRYEVEGEEEFKNSINFIFDGKYEETIKEIIEMRGVASPLDIAINAMNNCCASDVHEVLSNLDSRGIEFIKRLAQEII